MLVHTIYIISTNKQSSHKHSYEHTHKNIKTHTHTHTCALIIIIWYEQSYSHSHHHQHSMPSSVVCPRISSMSSSSASPSTTCSNASHRDVRYLPVLNSPVRTNESQHENNAVSGRMLSGRAPHRSSMERAYHRTHRTHRVAHQHMTCEHTVTRVGSPKNRQPNRRHRTHKQKTAAYANVKQHIHTRKSFASCSLAQWIININR